MDTPDLSPIRQLSAEAHELAETVRVGITYEQSDELTVLATLDAELVASVIRNWSDCATRLDRLTDEGALERVRKAISDDIDAHINGEPWDGHSAALAALNALLAGDGAA